MMERKLQETQIDSNKIDNMVHTWHAMHNTANSLQPIHKHIYTCKYFSFFNSITRVEAFCVFVPLATESNAFINLRRMKKAAAAVMVMVAVLLNGFWGFHG